MKFTINRSVFVNQLNNVLRAISSKTTIPILTGVKIVVEDQKVVLTGSNADITIQTTLSVDDGQTSLTIEEPGAIVLPARFFGEIIKRLPNQEVTVEVRDGFQAKISSGSAEFKINGQDANNYPHLPEIESASTINVSADLLRDVVEQTRIAVSKQESRPILTGIHMRLADDQLTAVATDSHRLAQRKVAVPTNGQSYDVVIPGSSMTELARMIADIKDDIQIQIAENQVLFQFGNALFYSRLFEGMYPETSRLIPDTADTTVELEAGNFLAAIDRASLLSHQGHNNVVKLTLDPENNSAKISGDSADVGNVEEDVTFDKLDGAKLEISFNPDYMSDALKSFGQTSVLLSFTSPLRPFTLVPTEDQENFVQLITPVRTF
ncbi:DNA polymerase III subunit beta [uncultured Limosilactobacillus sp.]|uniref:DNA polymerase III subunit beta n=1 Tax=uncultured Limosilactobacillus sp. TaxID=2837629 RepID=UPI0025E3C41B|nr:DNA polymerase III subunit beta [uncultured Limosilactobacillus sp.]